MKRAVLPALLAVALAACAPAGEAPKESEAPPSEQAGLETEIDPEVAGSAGELDVAFELGFTEYAATRLAELGETVTISGIYYGEPVPEVRDQMTEADGPLYVIGTFEVMVGPVNQTVNVLDSDIDPAKLANLTDAPRLNVNIFTSRTQHPDNLIDCTLIDGEVGELRAKPPATLCEMLDAN